MKRGLGAILTTLYVFAGAAIAEELKTDNHKPYYSAELLSYNKYFRSNRHKSRIIMSPYGVRVESKGIFFNGEKGIYTQSFLDKKIWVINPQKKHYALLDNYKESQEAESLENKDRLGGVMSSRACLGYESENKKIIGKKILDADEIILYHCKNNEEIIKQQYSVYWKMVIREESSTGNIAELRKIKAANFGELFFKPPLKYREVSLQEFYTGAPPLAPYDSTFN